MTEHFDQNLAEPPVTPPIDQVPPRLPDQETPVAFAAYPRATIPDQVPGTPDQLIALSRGFVWLMWTWLLAIAAMFDVFGLPGDLRNFSIPPVILALGLSVILYPGCRKIAYGMSWHPILGVFCALVLGTSSVFCIGLFLFAVLLQQTTTRIFQYGVPRNFFGAFRRVDVLNVASYLKQRNSLTNQDLAQHQEP